MKKKITLRSKAIAERAKVLIDNVVRGDVLHEIEIKPYKVNRSAQQNSFYWEILTIIGNELGYGKDELHTEYKDKFLIAILVRDDEDFARMMHSVERLDTTDFVNISTQITRLTSTTKLNVKQMNEYLDDIKHHATSLGIRLPQEG